MKILFLCSTLVILCIIYFQQLLVGFEQSVNLGVFDDLAASIRELSIEMNKLPFTHSREPMFPFQRHRVLKILDIQGLMYTANDKYQNICLLHLHITLYNTHCTLHKKFNKFSITICNNPYQKNRIDYIFLVEYNIEQPLQHSSFIHCPKSSQAMVTVSG